MGDGVKAAIPVFVGYFPIAIAFGILSRGAGLNLLETLSFSFIVFAGASQFIAVSMIAMGASAAEIIMTTFFLNFRHFLMSSSLSTKIEFSNPVFKPIVAFFVTDETFSVASFAEGRLTERYMLPLQILAYLGWGAGTGTGYLLGSILPLMLQQSINIGLYAMFVALLVPEIKKTRKAIILAALSGIVNSILVSVLGMPQGWGIVISILVVSAAGVFIYGRYELEYEELKAENSCEDEGNPLENGSKAVKRNE
ncbi:4-azaleucine resistance probable transporter AzlC [Dethiosulfatibacter aminovorans DSM 17477]|uniref:4-azaleucine resistance probable transporter AzlC n=1 Tax=Dethiosulfatibacter aminovorans DSM 17477 TaxID=1121476 RepID=A0A1M6AWN1_9FIRM|nr:AzlC family ABC transporter permease [Dethiosulfatibacter aminovorans]SHI40959.1 4-azaleucine resistance probable transporter AzlC [Dethiosulfatibacter aminovorans DSM 17477]